MSAAVTIAQSRHQLAVEANHEAVVIVDLLKKKLTGLDLSPDDLMLMRGLAQRLGDLTDVVFNVIADEPIDEGETAKRLGLAA